MSPSNLCQDIHGRGTKGTQHWALYVPAHYEKGCTGCSQTLK